MPKEYIVWYCDACGLEAPEHRFKVRISSIKYNTKSGMATTVKKIHCPTCNKLITSMSDMLDLEVV